MSLPRTHDLLYSPLTDPPKACFGSHQTLLYARFFSDAPNIGRRHRPRLFKRLGNTPTSGRSADADTKMRVVSSDSSIIALQRFKIGLNPIYLPLYGSVLALYHSLHPLVDVFADASCCEPLLAIDLRQLLDQYQLPF